MRRPPEAHDWSGTPLGPIDGWPRVAEDGDLDLPRVPLRDLRLLGPGPRRDLQRRVRPDARRQAPGRHGDAPARHLAGDLGPDRADAARRHRVGPGHVAGRPAAAARAQAASRRRRTSPTPSARSAATRARWRVSPPPCTDESGCSGRGGWRRWPRSASGSPWRARSRRSPPPLLERARRGPRATSRSQRLHLLGEDGPLGFAGSRGERRHAPPTTGPARRRPRSAGERVLDRRGRAVLVVLLPVGRPGSSVPAAALVLGASPHQKLYDGYRNFLRMVARQLSASALERGRPRSPRSMRADDLAALDRAKNEIFSNVLDVVPQPVDAHARPLGDVLADPIPDPAAQRERNPGRPPGALRLLRPRQRAAGPLPLRGLPRARRASPASTSAASPATLPWSSARRSTVSWSSSSRSTRPLTPPTIDADPDIVEKILLNLLSNEVQVHTSRAASTLRHPRSPSGAVIEVA